MADAELARRMFAAVNALEGALGRKVTLDEIGARVAEHEEGGVYCADCLLETTHGVRAS
jgi:hypothetical protein